MPSRPDSTQRAVDPLRGAVPYQGGKRNLASRVIAAIERVPHTTYVEPFVGAGGVFFRRRYAPTAEVINDVSNDVATFFRVLQRHYVAFIDMMRFQLTTRSEFQRLVATNVETLTDLERAARFYYLQRTGFGGKIRSRVFGVDAARPARFDITRLAPELEELHARLSGVVIERLPYDQLITRYDRPTTLFYLDPPYYGCERDYGDGLFDRADFERMAEQLASLKGRFILSLNDHADVRATFRAFSIASVSTTYTIGGGRRGAKRVREVLITDGRESASQSLVSRPAPTTRRSK